MRRLLIFVVIVILLLVGIDIGGRALAESKAGEAIGTRTGTPAPAVHIHGFSFLVQALPGHYSNITLTSSDITVGPISGIGATMQLYTVDFPFGDAIKGDTTQLTAAQATLTAVITDAEIARAISQTGVTVSAGPGGAIRLSAGIAVAGRTVAVSADLVPSFASGVLRLDATGVSAAGIALPNVAELTRNLSLALPLGDLPFTVDAATLTASGPDLILTATANEVRVIGPS